MTERITWVAPQFSRSKVNSAGLLLASSLEGDRGIDPALDILNNWRASHSFPLNSIQMDLRQKARRIYPNAFIGQRLKRVPSIVRKLQRETKMQLARMQDIAGCRAVVLSVSDVNRLYEAFQRSKANHQLVNNKDYISNPKSSGYRGVHLVYRFYSPISREYDGLHVEIQLRSRMQHAWATAVETVGTLLSQSLKASEGERRWLDFFKLAGSVFASDEGTSPIPGTSQSKEEVLESLVQATEDLNVRSRLQTYSNALKIPSDMRFKNARYFLLSLLPREGRLKVRGYRSDQLERAAADYLSEEKQLSLFPGMETVLVAAESIAALKRTHPNYFLDTQIFLEQLQRLTRKR